MCVLFGGAVLVRVSGRAMFIGVAPFGTSEVLLDSVSVATASNSESEKTVSIDFTDGNTLQINDKGDAIILVKGLAFKCLMQERVCVCVICLFCNVNMAYK